MSKPVDITGQRFGRLVAIKRVGHSMNGNAMWQCQCDCGNQTVVDVYRLRHGGVLSCGCLRREVSRCNILSNPKTVAKMRPGATHEEPADKPVHMSLRNTSGVTGVSWDAAAERWVARLMVKGKLVLNRTFDHFSDAVAARHQAEIEYHVPPRKPHAKKKRSWVETI